MTAFQLTPYATNSAEAILRAIALFVMSDGEVADSEMDALESLGVLKTLGVDRERFALVIDAYCDDLIAHAGSARYVGLADPDWVDAVLASVTDNDRRRYVAATLLLVAQADGRFAEAELTVYHRMLELWGIDIAELTAAAGPGDVDLPVKD